jgi:hypothetical protein
VVRLSHAGEPFSLIANCQEERRTHAASLPDRVPPEVLFQAKLVFIGAIALAEPFFLRADEAHARARQALAGVARDAQAELGVRERHLR